MEMEMETFTKTYSGTLEVVYRKSILSPDGAPIEARLTVPGGIGINSISEECALRNKHKLAGVAEFYMKL
jgi:hypothetical protein